MDTFLMIRDGQYTVERFAEEQGLRRQSALNKLAQLKVQGLVTVSGGGRQKRIYTVSVTPRAKTNGFYDMVNRYSPEKLVPRFAHVVHGRYTAEQAIIDGLRIGDARTKEATMHLFRHVSSWKLLFALARKERLVVPLRRLYAEARQQVRVKALPRRYAV
ncbi:MAG: hypothetical protein V1735_00860 [Nanoarchaeota archaeon]